MTAHERLQCVRKDTHRKEWGETVRMWSASEELKAAAAAQRSWPLQMQLALGHGMQQHDVARHYLDLGALQRMIGLVDMPAAVLAMEVGAEVRAEEEARKAQRYAAVQEWMDALSPELRERARVAMETGSDNRWRTFCRAAKKAGHPPPLMYCGPSIRAALGMAMPGVEDAKV